MGGVPITWHTVCAFHFSSDSRLLQHSRQLIDNRMHAWELKAAGNVNNYACALVVALIWPQHDDQRIRQRPAWQGLLAQAGVGVDNQNIEG